jgi:hypothetical protein
LEGPSSETESFQILLISRFTKKQYASALPERFKSFAVFVEIF